MRVSGSQAALLKLIATNQAPKVKFGKNGLSWWFGNLSVTRHVTKLEEAGLIEVVRYGGADVRLRVIGNEITSL